MAASWTTPWRWISGTLGVICLLLVAALGILLRKSLLQQSTELTISQGATTEFHEDFGSFSCQERWIGYQCNCYFISTDLKTWNDSRHFCASQNSTLIQMDNKDELSFMKTNTKSYWIGVYSGNHGVFVWEDGSAVPLDLFRNNRTSNPKNCVVYIPRYGALGEHCEKQNIYICKQRFH